MNTIRNNKVIGLFGFSVDNIDMFRVLFNANVEINMFELPRENANDSVKKVDNIFIHQYALPNKIQESRIDEILRDMLAINADYYFLVRNKPFYNEVYKMLTYYGCKVVIL